MKLIDAETFKELWKDCKIEGSLDALIDARPIVDAIPVEWIEDVYMKYMKTLKDSDNSPMAKKWFELRILAYRMLIRDWRKENDNT